MSCSPFRDQLDNSDNVFLKMPHIFKPLQTISAAATVVFALGVQDVLMNSLTNGGVAWNVVVCLFVFLHEPIRHPHPLDQSVLQLHDDKRWDFDGIIN
uniref:Aa_trans domain-containing protein n=1 Tax=Heterorhabditis bacteriophora TaxID=37862 RepID=A0A1I7WS90_HETBA